jgi:predicted ATPase
MYIESLIIKGLYGHYNKSIKFKKDCTLLVGINGSGKTTILKIIYWLLTPSIPELSSTKFDIIKMVFNYNGIKHIILCEQINKELRYKLTVGDKEFEPLVASLIQDPSLFKNDYRIRESIKRSYERLSPESKEIETWETIQSIPTPVFLGIDRNPHYWDRDSEDDRKSFKSSDQDKALNYSSKLLRNAFTQENANVLKLTERFKSKLMLYAFDSVLDVKTSIPERNRLPSTQQIEKVESRVLELCKSESLNKEDVARVNNYFEQLKTIGNQDESTPNGNINFLVNIKQFEKVKNILKDFEEFENKKQIETDKTDTFIRIMNDFLKDSNKALYFSPASSNVEYQIIDKHQKVVEDGLDIHYLSSGEQQLLVLFTNIIFESPNHVYIIDEPELSLHVKWLEMLYPHLEEVFPSDDQLIIATHSPILADKKRDNALVLYPY